jgi:hypothetical protein
MNLTIYGNNPLAKNMNCSFIKEILMEIHPDLVIIQEGMMRGMYLAFGLILFMFFLSVGSFLLWIRLNRMNSPAETKKDEELTKSLEEGQENPKIPLNKVAPLDDGSKMRRFQKKIKDDLIDYKNKPENTKQNEDSMSKMLDSSGNESPLKRFNRNEDELSSSMTKKKNRFRLDLDDNDKKISNFGEGRTGIIGR